MTNRVILRISDNQGYSPDQITTRVNLGRLLEAVESAVEEFGAEALIVLNNGQRYGASYGAITDNRFGELFQAEDADEGGEDE